MAIPDEYKDIIEALSSATLKERIKWTAARFGLELAVGGSKFVLDAGNDENRKRGFVSFALSETDGKTLDIWRVDEGSQEYDFMYGMYTGARRKALGIPQRLDSIREELRKSNILCEPSSHDEKAQIPS